MKKWKMEDIIKNIDKLIDINLKSFIESDSSVFVHFNFKGMDGEKTKNYKRIGKIMKDEGLLTSKNDNFYELEPKAIEIYNSGGWIKHKENERENIEKLKKKANYDYNFSKYRAKTFIAVFIIGLFGGIYSAVDLILKIYNNKDYQTEQNPIKEPISTSLNKHTLPSSQTYQDSLNNSNIQSNSQNEEIDLIKTDSLFKSLSQH
jgi:hypothetical protein